MKYISITNLNKVLLNQLFLIICCFSFFGTLFSSKIYAQTGSDWYMSGANPERTSWVSTEVSGNLNPVWARPIDPYIPASSQLILTNNTVYVSTARGLYALDAANGSQKWTYATELPLGNSPTVLSNGTNYIAYVGGMDHKIYAIRDNGSSASLVWAFEVGASYPLDTNEVPAGFDTNPLVVNGLVIVGNRNGYLYAVNQSTGQFAWRFKTGGGMHFSPAYKNNVVYIASNDSYAYAVNVSDGTQRWKSPKLPVIGFHSYWPVIYTNPATGQDTVVLAGSENYRTQGLGPGSGGAGDLENLDKNDFINNIIGMSTGNINFTQASAYWEEPTAAEKANDTDGIGIPGSDRHFHKPWRRTVFVLNAANGTELTWDINGNGRAEYSPIFFYGTRSGTRYPPIAPQSDTNYLYIAQTYDNCGEWCVRGQVTGWRMGTNTMKIAANATQANDEPIAYSSGGNVIYWSVCCDRTAGSFSLVQSNGNYPNWSMWSYDLQNIVQNYDVKVMGQLESWAVQVYGDRRSGTGWGGQPAGYNGVYGSHGDQNPPIPYNGRVYIHRGNAIIAFSPTGGDITAASVAPTVPKTDPPFAVNTAALTARLSSEVQSIVGTPGGTLGPHLRPGYGVHGAFHTQSAYGGYADYFRDPGDMFLALSRAYPYLSTSLQNQVKSYLARELTNYSPCDYSNAGWQGASRDSLGPTQIGFDMLPDIEAYMTSGPSGPGSPRSLYAMWKYAQNTGANASQLLSDCSGMTSNAASTPEEANASVASWLGYRGLYMLANNITNPNDSRLSSINSSLNSVMNARSSNFSSTVNNANGGPESHSFTQMVAVSRNFMFLTPELGIHLRTSINSTVTQVFNLFSSLAPYWMAEKYQASYNENIVQPSFDYEAMFNAKAWVMNATREDLARYVDGPGYVRGDLFFINNLVTVLEAPSNGASPAPSGTPGPSASPCGQVGDVNNDCQINATDLKLVISNLFGVGQCGSFVCDLNLDNKINIIDAALVILHWTN